MTRSERYEALGRSYVIGHDFVTRKEAGAACTVSREGACVASGLRLEEARERVWLLMKGDLDTDMAGMEGRLREVMTYRGMLGEGRGSLEHFLVREGARPKLTVEHGDVPEGTRRS